MNPREWIASRNVVVCSGPGGVGKTTISATIALAEARRGRKVLVLTIDPARRLANALGLERFDSEIQSVPAERFTSSGGEFKGSLDAMMLDVKAEWDAVMSRYAPNKEQVGRILQNRMYNYLSDNLVGAQEFMAMERLYHLHHEGKYDLIVLDTPPTKHALDFLEAPRKMFQFLEDGTFVRVFLETGKGSMRFLKVGTTAVFKVLEKIIGSSVISDITEFVSNLEGYYEGFRDRSRAVYDLLQSDKALFLLITAPTPLALSETRYFHQKLAESKIPFGGFIFNRVHEPANLPEKDRPAAVELFENREQRARLLGRIEGDADLGPKWASLVSSLADNFVNLETLAEVEAKKIHTLGELLKKEQFVVRIPFLDQDIHDPAGLEILDRHIFGK